eukprot:gene28042-33861_t
MEKAFDDYLVEDFLQELVIFTGELQVDETSGSYDDFGQNSYQWQSFLSGMQSRKQYEKQVQSFISFHISYALEHPECSDLTENAVRYFDYLRSKVDGKGDPLYAPTTMRSFLSMLTKFWQMTGKGDLKTMAPLIENNLDKWDKIYKPVKAKVFTKEQIGYFLRLADTPQVLLQKAYCVLSIAFAARGYEACTLSFDMIASATNEQTKERMYCVTFQRAKNTGPLESHRAFVLGAEEVGVLDNYFSCFKDINKERLNKGRFFRRLLLEHGVLKATESVIGKNTLAQCGKLIARALDLEDPDMLHRELQCDEDNLRNCRMPVYTVYAGGNNQRQSPWQALSSMDT